MYTTEDQTAPTIEKLLVEEIISRQGVPAKLLSNRGPSFLSKSVLGICEYMGVSKVNTNAYHPQTNGHIELFNRTLTDMLDKSVALGVTEWDERLPYILLSYFVCNLQPETLHSFYCIDEILIFRKRPYFQLCMIHSRWT